MNRLLSHRPECTAGSGRHGCVPADDLPRNATGLRVRDDFLAFGRCLPLLGIGLLSGGCAHSPSVNVLGAFFPDWMFCIAGAAVLAACTHGVARATGLDDRLGPRWLATVEVLLAIAFALGGWLLVFEN